VRGLGVKLPFAYLTKENEGGMIALMMVEAINFEEKISNLRL